MSSMQQNMLEIRTNLVPNVMLCQIAINLSMINIDNEIYNYNIHDLCLTLKVIMSKCS